VLSQKNVPQSERFFDNHYKMVSNFLGLTQSTVGLLFMVVLVGMGERMAERFLPMYLLALGDGMISIGLLNGLDNFLSAVYAFPGGYLSERIGYKRSLFVFQKRNPNGILGLIEGAPSALIANRISKHPSQTGPLRDNNLCTDSNFGDH
jgi:hypothetical protein